MINAAKAWALMEGHSGVLPEDLQAIFKPVANHRLRLKSASGSIQGNPAERVLAEVPIP